MDRYEKLYDEIKRRTKTDAVKLLRKEMAPSVQVKTCVAKHATENVLFVEISDPEDGIIAIERQDLDSGEVITFTRK